MQFEILSSREAVNMKHTYDTVYFGVNSSTFQRYTLTPSIEKKMNAAGAASFANSVELCQTIKHHMPADSSLHDTVA
jgi:hypothetical protein